MMWVCLKDESLEFGGFSLCLEPCMGHARGIAGQFLSRNNLYLGQVGKASSILQNKALLPDVSFGFSVDCAIVYALCSCVCLCPVHSLKGKNLGPQHDQSPGNQ